MTYRWSVLENDEVEVDEYDYADAVCAECGDGVEEEFYSDDDEAFCKPCYDNIFGED